MSISASNSSSGTLHYATTGLPAGLSINASTGTITGTVSPGDASFGPYSVQVTATDGANTDSQTFAWNINHNSTITFTNPGTQTSAEAATISLSLSASYSGSGSLVYSASGLPAGLKINTSTGTITGTVALGDAALAPYSITAEVSVGSSTASQTFAWNITGKVTITNPGDQTNSEGDTVALSISASISSGGTLSYSATGLPPGLKINPSTGAITGTVAVGDAAGGPYGTTVMAGDGTYSSSQTFAWNVTSPVTITNPGDQTNNEGTTISLSINATGSGTLSYSALGLPGGLHINPTSGAITGTVGAGDAASGPYSVTVEISNGTYSAQTNFNWNINGAVVLTSPGDQTMAQGASASLMLSATGSGTLSYSASGLPTGLSINSSTGAISGTASTGGTWHTTATASNGTYSDSVAFSWTISSTINITDPGTQNNKIGDTVSLTISATDTSSGTLSYSASGLPTGLSINSSTGVISGTVSTSASTAAPYSSTVTVSDGTHSAVDTFSWYISAAGSVSLTNPGSQTNAVGDDVYLSLQASDSSGGTLLYTSNSLPPGLLVNPNTGLIFGTIASGAIAGSPYAVTVTANDGSSSDSQSFSWTVSTSDVVTLAFPGNQTNAEGDTVSVTLNGQDTGSGTLSYSALGLPPGLKVNFSTGAITGTIALGDAASGPYTVTAEANDGTYSATQTFAWNVTGAVTLSNPGDQTNNEGDTVSLTLSATDSSSGTLSYAATGLPAGLKINPSTGAITGTVATGGAADGPYSVTATASDGTYSDSQTFTWTITSPITVTNPGDQTNNEGDTVSLAISASGSGTLSYSAQGLPPGLHINSTTGAITGTIAAGDSSIGSFEPTIVVSNGTYSGNVSFGWTVKSPITIIDPGDQTNTVGDTISLQIQASGGSSYTYVATGLPGV